MTSNINAPKVGVLLTKLEFMFMNHYAPNRYEPIGVGGGPVGGRGQGGCEPRIEVIVKI